MSQAPKDAAAAPAAAPGAADRAEEGAALRRTPEARDRKSVV